ncbi:hypothetical protein NPIL_388021 [Nephila pilipes]|uniref:Uncharacterized protein n=1 Tax=Nephila pilipes TaxID=299642 RepID=A0A8X6QWL8_NEPPI|nr:hypothetical protein NPIL_388021 [Nephila pilipes]
MSFVFISIPAEIKLFPLAYYYVLGFSTSNMRYTSEQKTVRGYTNDVAPWKCGNRQTSLTAYSKLSGWKYSSELSFGNCSVRCILHLDHQFQPYRFDHYVDRIITKSEDYTIRD